MTAIRTLPVLVVPDAEPPSRFLDLVAAEWIKMRSLRSVPWTVALVAVFVIAASAIAALVDYRKFPHYSAGIQQERPFALTDAYSQPAYFTLALVAASVGAISVVSEYSSGLIRTTTAAVPARGSVVLAKAVVVTALWTVLGVITASGSFLVSQAILSRRHASITLDHPAALRALVASALVAPVCALIGLSLGVLIRHSATTIVASAGTLLIVPIFFSTTRRWSADVNHAMVLSAWFRLSRDWASTSGPGQYVSTVPASWIVYAAWPAVAVLLSLAVVRRRDV